MNPSDPLRDTVRWLSTHARFPASRLETRAETLLCVAALATAEEAAELARTRHLVQSRDGAKDSALRSYNHRRTKVHYVCDNSAKV